MALGVVLRTGILTGLGGFGAAMVATSLGLTTREVLPALVLRTILVTMLLVLLVPVLLRTVAAEPGRPVLASVAAGALLGYWLDPFAWSGRAYAAQLLHGPGALTLVVDLVLWVLAASAGAAWRLPHRPKADRVQRSAYI